MKMFAIRFLIGLLMVVLPVSLAAFIHKKFKTGWKLWWIGGSVFILSQLGHIPFNYYSSLILNKTNIIYWPNIYQTIFNAFFLGLSAGLWEEISRYAALRWWVRSSRSWSKGIQLGVGHGGFESIILGTLVTYTFLQMVAVKNIDISTIVPPDQIAKVTESITTYWATPWYDAILGIVERVFTLPIHIALSVIVLQVFIRGKSSWIWIAILFHTVVDATTVLMIKLTNIYLTEIMVAFFAAVSLWIIFALRSPEPQEKEVVSERIFFEKKGNIKDLDETIDNLNATRFQ